MAETNKHKLKRKRNYNELRILNQKKLKQINDIYIEAQLTVSGLELKRASVTGRSQTERQHLNIYVPSMRGKNANITRKYEYICAMIEDRIHYKEYVQSLIFAISLTEAYISEILIIMLHAYPEKLLVSLKGNDEMGGATYPVDMRDILKAKSFDAFIIDKAEQRAHDALFASPKSYINYMEKILSFKFPDGVLERFSEIKATRDIYVHGSGAANEIYLKKAGKLARAAAGEAIVVDQSYLKLSVSCMKDIFSAIYTGMLDSHGDSEEIEKVLSAR